MTTIGDSAILIFKDPPLFYLTLMALYLQDIVSIDDSSKSCSLSFTTPLVVPVVLPSPDLPEIRIILKA